MGIYPQAILEELLGKLEIVGETSHPTRNIHKPPILDGGWIYLNLPKASHAGRTRVIPQLLFFAHGAISSPLAMWLQSPLLALPMKSGAQSSDGKR